MRKRLYPPTAEELEKWKTDGKWLRKRLEDCEVTQSWLAGKIGVSRASIVDYIAGQRPVPAKHRPRICEALHCEPDDIWKEI